MHVIIRALTVCCALILPCILIAQDGLGRIDYTGKKQNRPFQSKEISHPNGAAVTCFSLPGNSCNRDDCKADRERTQLLQSKPDNLEGNAYRYKFSVFLPKNFKDVRPANLILWEVKPRGSGKPSAVIEVIDGYLQFSLSNPNQTQADKLNPLKPVLIKRLGAIPRGRWSEFTLDVKWSQANDGVLRLSLNGRNVVFHEGPNIDANSKRQMVMYGLYRSFISRYLTSRGANEMPLQQACFANISRAKIEM